MLGVGSAGGGGMLRECWRSVRGVLGVRSAGGGGMLREC